MKHEHKHSPKYGWVIIQKSSKTRRVYIMASDWLGSFGPVIADAPTMAEARKLAGL